MLDTPAVAPSARPLVEAYRAARNDLPDAQHPDIRSRRDAAMARFAQMGLPTRRDEAWKYTDLRRLTDLTPQIDRGGANTPIPAALDAVLAEADEAVHALVFVNGCYRADLSFLGALPDGVVIEPLSDATSVKADDLLGATALEDLDAVGLAAVALATDGVRVHVAAQAVLDRPLRLVHLLTGDAEAPAIAAPHVALSLGDQASLTVVEHWATDPGGASVALPRWDIAVGRGARLRHYTDQSAGLNTVHLGRASVTVAQDASLETFVLTAAGGLIRNETHVTIAGRGADVALGGVYLGSGDRHVDTTTSVQHTDSDGRSRQVYRGVLDDRSRGVFQGKVGVDRPAQRTDGHQLSNTLLLSPKAEMDAKPELEIFADDVRCSHGATTGDLDADALFYLRARGIDEAVARGLLIEAFIAEAIDEVSDPTVAERFKDTARDWWHAHSARG